MNMQAKIQTGTAPVQNPRSERREPIPFGTKPPKNIAGRIHYENLLRYVWFC